MSLSLNAHRCLRSQRSSHFPPPRSSSSPGGTEGTDKGARATATVTDSSKADAKEKLGEADDGHTLMSEQEKEILAKLRKEFPGGTVAVQDVSGELGEEDRRRSLALWKRCCSS